MKASIWIGFIATLAVATTVAGYLMGMAYRLWATNDHIRSVSGDAARGAAVAIITIGAILFLNFRQKT